MNWIVEKAQHEEAIIIAGFQVDMAEESEKTLLDSSLVERGVSEGMKDENKGVYYVVKTEDGIVVGSLFLTREWSDWRCAWYWWIQSVYVRPEYRRRGAYRALYEYVKQKARENNVSCVRLYVDKTNRQGMATYASLGMRESHYLLYEENL
ncbi:MAG: GNAT family N-acetyltransferase [Paludibacteraceae bacterium]|nr:GNAT family N-acetyltransferase [Paludibacteraceae bacterium]